MAKYLFQDGTDIKAYVAGAWQIVGQAPVTEAMFLNSGMADLTTINNAAMQALATPSPTLRYYTTDALAHTSTMVAVPSGKLISAKDDLITEGFSLINSITVTSTVTGGGAIKIIVSVDKGITWQTWNGSAWVVVNANDLAAVKASGMTPAILNGLVASNWTSLRGSSKTIRLSYYLEQNLSSDTASTDILKFNVNMNGQWKMALEGSDFNYGYARSDEIRVKIKTNGDFKINY